MVRYFGSFGLGLLMVMVVLIAMQGLVVGRQFQLNAGANGDASSVVNLNNQVTPTGQITALPDKPGSNRAPILPEDPPVPNCHQIGASDYPTYRHSHLN